MSFPKPKRKTDKKFLATFKAMPCLVCGGKPSEGDHIRSKGAGGGDEPFNVWNLDRRCHIERHRRGLTGFVEKYDSARAWLLANGWAFDENRKRWGRG